jgi:CubicO group peptidase (beta-lactamase class C family)
MRLLPSLMILALLTGSATAQKPGAVPYFPPAGSWEHRPANTLGMDTARLSAAVRYAQDHETRAPRDLRKAHYESAFGREPFGYPAGPLNERGPATGLVIYKGYVVAEWGDPDRSDLTFSMAKSFLSSTAGLAFDSGLIRNISDKAYRYMAPIIPYDPLGNYGDRSNDLSKPALIDLFGTPHNREISWDDLLRQTSDWEGTLWGKPDWADRPSDTPSTWMNRRLNTPGTVYEYNDTRVNVLALALLNVWRQPLPQVLKAKLMDPIGASNAWRWTGYNNSWVVLDGVAMQSVSGGSHWGGGLFINAWDQARFAYLTLRNGKWRDRQVLSTAWLKMARTPTVPQPDYGFMNFFLNTGKKQFPSAPESAFAHIGAGENVAYVDPEHDLVVVARWIDPKAEDEMIRLILESLPR